MTRLVLFANQTRRIGCRAGAEDLCHDVASLLRGTDCLEVRGLRGDLAADDGEVALRPVERRPRKADDGVGLAFTSPADDAPLHLAGARDGLGYIGAHGD